MNVLPYTQTQQICGGLSPYTADSMANSMAKLCYVKVLKTTEVPEVASVAAGIVYMSTKMIIEHVFEMAETIITPELEDLS